MKFIGLRVEDHDSNITYTDGTKVKYLSTERYFHIKHHGLDNTWQWQDLTDELGVHINEVDALCIVSDQVTFDEGELYREIDIGLPCKTFAIDHHWAHVLSQWPVGIPYTNYVFDGYGSNERSHSLFLGDKLELSHSVNIAGSIGIEMAKVGATLGLADVTPHGLDLAGKIMGLAAYGIIDTEYMKFLNQFPISRVKDIWNYDQWTRKWDDNFDINWLRTVHEVTANKLAEYVGNGDDRVGYTGGVALNCVFNGRITQTGQDITTIPHANDCGLSLGAVEFLRQHFHADEFDATGFPFWQDDEAPEEVNEDTIITVAEELAQGNIVAWYQGHGEIGPRALGHRSILANPRCANMKDVLNSKVKHREHFRPYGASVLREDAPRHFDVPEGANMPWMNVSVNVTDSNLQSVTHIDGTSRVQTVEGDDCFARLLRAYKDITGDSVLLNTSLNLGGSPIASCFWEAKELFSKKDIDFLCIGNDLLHK
jgi:carbamoyltransferase